MLDAMTRPVHARLTELGKDKLAEMYARCFRSTWDTTLQQGEDGTVFLITGDIPAMWLRDSAAQVRHYLRYAPQVPQVSDAIEGLLKKQFEFIVLDPYANAFNREGNGHGHQEDRTEMSPWIWERKYEIDSLCYPLHLAYDYWKLTGRTGWYGDTFQKASRSIVRLWKTEQRHMERSGYTFERMDCVPSDTLPHGGRGAPVTYTGMTWSGFRPSDDACRYGYLVPANLFAAAVLKKLEEIVSRLDDDPGFEDEIRSLAAEIRQGVEQHGTVLHQRFGKIYAYETDGMGNYNLMDDANVPSLLSLPYLGCCSASDPVYQNTRRFILSSENPYYYEGRAARGIGSPHTPAGYVWPISLCMQGLTSTDRLELDSLADMLQSIDADTYYMHEGVDVNDPQQYTRPWFAWANSLFSEFVEHYCEALS